MSMINSVRETVLSILNKNNYGYIGPTDFNLFAKQAQLDIFEDYFYQYNFQINKENIRQSGTGLADIKKKYEEVIEIFSEQKFLQPLLPNGGTITTAQIGVTGTFSVPTVSTTGSDYYLLNKILLLTKYLVFKSTNTGVDSSVNGPTFSDNTVNFYTSGVKPGDVVVNITSKQTAQVTYVDVITPDTLILDSVIFNTIGDSYSVLSLHEGVNECEKVSAKKITQLNMSHLTKPTELFPAYSQNANLIQIYPENFQWQPVVSNVDFLTESQLGRIFSQYIRYPKDPKWTSVSLVGGEPAFDPSDALYQDFELPLVDEPTLVNKILQYAGMSIREVDAIKFGQSNNIQEQQKEQI